MPPPSTGRKYKARIVPSPVDSAIDDARIARILAYFKLPKIIDPIEDIVFDHLSEDGISSALGGKSKINHKSSYSRN